MWLAIDVGNTQIVLGLFENQNLKHQWRIATHPLRTPDELRIVLSALLAEQSVPLLQIESVLLSSVVPSVTTVMQRTFEDWHRRGDLRKIDHLSPFSFSIAASPAEQVGSDRLVNAEAVFRLYGAPAVVVDSGTATTLCALGKGGHYLGGAIMPGLQLSVETLAQKAAQLFSVELTPPPKAIGTHTREALQSGIVLGYGAMVDGMILRFKDELNNPDTVVVATGGVAELLRPVCREIQHYDRDLTLKGLAYLHESFHRL